MAEYKQVDLQIGTEAQFESKKETLPIGTIVGITDPIHKSELDSSLQTSIDSIANKLNKPSSNPTEDSVVKVSSTGNVSYKPLSEFGDSGLSLLDVYPVGSIYLSVNSTSPATLFGGVWERIQDKFLLGASNTYTAGLPGGEATHTLTTEELPEHYHNIIADGNGKFVGYNEGNEGNYYVRNDYTDSNNIGNQYVTDKVGGNKPHNNMPPYLAVYMWKRIS